MTALIVFCRRRPWSPPSWSGGWRELRAPWIYALAGLAIVLPTRAPIALPFGRCRPSFGLFAAPRGRCRSGRRLGPLAGRGSVGAAAAALQPWLRSDGVWSNADRPAGVIPIRVPGGSPRDHLLFVSSCGGRSRRLRLRGGDVTTLVVGHLGLPRSPPAHREVVAADPETMVPVLGMMTAAACCCRSSTIVWPAWLVAAVLGEVTGCPLAFSIRHRHRDRGRRRDVGGAPVLGPAQLQLIAAIGLSAGFLPIGWSSCSARDPASASHEGAPASAA